MNLGAFLEGLSLATAWPAIGFLMLGVLLGIWLGAVPGLGGALGIVLVLPFTYGMDAVTAFALLLGIYAVTSTSDTIASVMLGVPGTAASQSTILDGHPMAKRGEAARAFGAAFTVSAFGGIMGALILAVSLPIALPVILRFNNPELFSLALLGLVMVGSLAGKSLAKGLAAACFGLLLSTVGYADDSPIPRYWMNSTYLLDRLPLIPVVLGIFALPELFDLAVRNSNIASIPRQQGGYAMMREGVRDAFRNWWLALRCSFIGVYIGMIPGLGGAVVDWIAYGHAVQSTKNPERYGTGDIRGVIAPEAANNAMHGGALIPTVAFGVPGSATNALLLSALLIQGLQPGVQMLTTNLPLTFSMVWTLAIANLLAAGLLMIWSGQIARLAFISGHLIVPGVLLFVFMGAWLTLSNFGDWLTLFAFGIIGYLMKQGGWPRPPIVLAFILGGLMENSFLLSWRIHQGIGWIDRPIVMGILALILLTLAFSIRRTLRDGAKDRAAAPEPSGEGDDTLVAILFGLALLGLFVWALMPVFDWPTTVGLFPAIALVPGIVLVLMALAGDVLSARAAHPGRALATLWATTRADATLWRAALLFLWVAGMMGLALLVGQKLAITAFVFAYLLRWGGYRPRLAFVYAAACWVILVVFYDRIVQLTWMRPLWRDEIMAILPGWLPLWLVL